MTSKIAIKFVWSKGLWYSQNEEIREGDQSSLQIATARRIKYFQAVEQFRVEKWQDRFKLC